jgi:uncharacterized protein
LRQRLLKSYIIVIAGIVSALAGWALWIEPARLVVVEEQVDVPWLGRSALRVAVLTDLHVGSPFNGVAKLRDVVDRTNAARPDLVCILGDLVIQGVIGGHFIPPETIGGELARLRPAIATFAVLGNHDGWLDHDRVQRALEMSGAHMVEDTAVRVATAAGPVWIAGVSDLWTGRHDLAAALALVKDDGAPVLLLTHNPDIFPMVPSRVTLTLAGHTHGGQVQLPLIGAPIVPSQFGQRFAAGQIVEGGRHMLVATGIGTSIFPVRFRVPPTVSILVLGGRGLS